MTLDPLGIAGINEVWAYPWPNVGINDQMEGGNTGLAWLVELDPYDIEPGVQPYRMAAGGGLGVLGYVGLGEIFDLQRYKPIPLPTLRYTTLAGGVVTAASDAPADTWIAPRLKLSRIDVRRQLPVRDRFSGFLAQTSASVALDDGDGELDGLLTDMVLRDRPIRIKVAPTTRTARSDEAAPALSGFATVFEGLIAGLGLDNDGALTLSVADIANRLDRPIQEQLYPGTGGRQGGPELSGVPKPLNYGWVRAATPTLVDQILLIYQIHDGEVRSALPRDRGQALAWVRDVATYEALEALTVAGQADEPDIDSGQFATCRAQGYWRLGSQPLGTLTCDVEGDGLHDGPIKFDGGVLFDGGIGFDAPGSDTYNRYAGGMIFRILTTRGYISPDGIDLDRIRQFDRENPFELGLSIPSSERPTVREVCTAIADSVGAVILRSQAGKITLRALLGPAKGSSINVGRFEDQTDRRVQATLAPDGLERMALPWGAPWPKVRARYDVTWTPQDADAVVADATDEEREQAIRPARYASAEDAALAAILPDRELLDLPTLLRYRADAITVAARVRDFYAHRWALWRATCRGLSFRLDPLDTAQVIHPRFGLTEGRNLLVVGVQERPGRYETELTLFG